MKLICAGSKKGGAAAFAAARPLWERKALLRAWPQMCLKRG